MSKQVVLGRIQQLVREHYVSSDQPLLLSHLGAILVAEFGPLRECLEGDTLIQALGEISGLVVLRDPNISQRIAVAPQEKKEAVLEGIEKKSPIGAASSFEPDRLQRALVYAFQQDPADGEAVYISLRAPMRFQVSGVPPEPTDQYMMIPKERLRPNIPPARIENLQSDKQSELIQQIKKWLAEINLPAQRFYHHGRPAGSGNLLTRLIDAQPPEIRARLLIPADVVLRLTDRD